MAGVGEGGVISAAPCSRLRAYRISSLRESLWVRLPELSAAADRSRAYAGAESSAGVLNDSSRSPFAKKDHNNG